MKNAAASPRRIPLSEVPNRSGGIGANERRIERLAKNQAKELTNRFGIILRLPER